MMSHHFFQDINVCLHHINLCGCLLIAFGRRNIVFSKYSDIAVRFILKKQFDAGRPLLYSVYLLLQTIRSEERRVGKECRL